jgi:hypothetical protein
MASKVLKALNTAKLLIVMQVLSEWHFIKHEKSHAIFIRHYLYSASECTKHMVIDACPIVNSV